MIREKDWEERYAPGQRVRKAQQKRRRKRIRRFCTILLLLAFLTGWFIWQQNSLSTTNYTVSGAPSAFSGYRIVQLSDLHGKQFGEDDRRLLKLVEGLHPNLIAITGDIVDSPDQLDALPALAKGLSAIAPTCYVTGNHEWAIRLVPEIKSILTDGGVFVLTNDYILLEIEGQTLAIAGTDDPNGPPSQKTGDVLRQELSADFTVLLTHRDRVEEYAGWGYDLILCGHSHGGMVRIPFWNRGLISNDRHALFPPYAGGAFPAGSGTCIVSRGLGSNTKPFPMFRLFNRPEVPVITLTEG